MHLPSRLKGNLHGNINGFWDLRNFTSTFTFTFTLIYAKRKCPSQFTPLPSSKHHPNPFVYLTDSSPSSCLATGTSYPSPPFPLNHSHHILFLFISQIYLSFYLYSSFHISFFFVFPPFPLQLTFVFKSHSPNFVTCLLNYISKMKTFIKL